MRFFSARDQPLALEPRRNGRQLYVIAMSVFLALSLFIRESFQTDVYISLFLADVFVQGNATHIESRFSGPSDEHPYLIHNAARAVLYLITCPCFSFIFPSHHWRRTENAKIRMWRLYADYSVVFSPLFGMLYCTTQDAPGVMLPWQFWFPLFDAVWRLLCLAWFKTLQTSAARAQMEEALKYAGSSLKR